MVSHCSLEGTTQGDPLAMVFYALATLPLIGPCKVSSLTGEAWFADDATGSGSIASLRAWWDKLVAPGPKFGYFPNGLKTWLVVKEDKSADALAALLTPMSRSLHVAGDISVLPLVLLPSWIAMCPRR